MLKILFITNIPSPYRVDFFNELGKQCGLTVLFEKDASGERDESWKKFKADNFNGIILKGKSIRTDTAFCPSVIKHINKRYDHIIISNISSPTGIFAIAYMKLHRIPYEIESDGGFPKNGKGLKEKLKKWLISGATCWFSTSDVHDEYYLKYGAKKEKIIRYPFTSLYEKDICNEVESSVIKSDLKKQLALPDTSIVLSVGRFSYQGGYGKGFDLLIKGANQLPNVMFVIVGDTPTDEILEMQKQYKADNINFVNFKAKKELFQYYRASDLFILPTRGDVWGLVINEAMANGLPVITTNKCIAGLELVDDENGALINADSVDDIVSSVNRVLQDEALRIKMSEKSMDRIRKYTFEEMAKVHISTWNSNL